MMQSTFNLKRHRPQTAQIVGREQPGHETPTEDTIKFSALMLGVNDIAEITGLSRSTIYRRVDDGTFPPPLKIGRRSLWMKHSFIRVLKALETASIQ